MRKFITLGVIFLLLQTATPGRAEKTKEDNLQVTGK